MPEITSAPPEQAIRNSDPLQSAVLMLVNGMTDKAAIATLETRMGLSAERALATVIQAREQISRTATFDQEKELGQAYIRLNSIYSHALAASDFKTAFAAQKEINKLIDLYKPLGFTPGSVGDNGEKENEIDLIRQHLAGLGLAPEGTSVPELARLAAATIISLQSNTGK